MSLPSAQKRVVPSVAWQELVAKYQNPELHRSLWQMVNSIAPFLALWYLMYRSLEVSYWLTLALAIPTSGFLMRIFIILHDCGHGSFFKSTAANDLVGSVCGVLTFTPYQQWRHSHAIHHATASDLDRRGTGDVLTITVSEYRALPWYKRLGYRAYRSWLVMFVLAPAFMFLVLHRFVAPTSGKRERFGVYLTNLALLALFLVLGWAIGFRQVIMIHLPLMLLSSSVGVWLFYIQHQFEDTYWEHHPEWRFTLAALQGSSYYKLPKILQWFSGNIGFHHIHHLSPKIPNYNLPKAFEENTLFQHVTAVTLWESFEAASLKLWDEEHKKLVSFRHLKSAASR